MKKTIFILTLMTLSTQLFAGRFDTLSCNVIGNSPVKAVYYNNGRMHFLDQRGNSIFYREALDLFTNAGDDSIEVRDYSEGVPYPPTFMFYNPMIRRGFVRDRNDNFTLQVVNCRFLR